MEKIEHTGRQSLIQILDFTNEVQPQLRQGNWSLQVIVQLFIITFEMSRSLKKGGPNQIPNFIAKLHQMLEDQNSLNTIDWTSQGDSFCIKNINKFTEDVLPIYFKHRNFASFIRQLNMYGFKKIRHNQGDSVYLNQNFKANAKHLLTNISRRIKEEKEEHVQVQIYRDNRHVEPQVGLQIQELRGNQKNIEELCRHFIEQNQQLLQQNQKLVRKMEQGDRQKQRKLQELLVFLLTQKDSKSLMSGKEEGMLSLTNRAHNHDNQNTSYSESPLQAIGNALDSDGNIHKARQLIQGIFSRKKGKRQNNYSLVEPKTSTNSSHQPSPFNQDENRSMEGEQQVPHTNLLDQLPPQDNKSFLSIKQFLNVEEDHHFNFDQSV